MVHERETAAQLHQFEASREVSQSPPLIVAPVALHRTARSTAGRAPARLADDPAYTGITLRSY